MALSHPSDGPALVKFCAQLFQDAKASRPTEMHQFIGDLSASRQLVRDYTQNIDCLEEKVGLSTVLSRGPGTWLKSSLEARRRPHESETIPRCRALGVECVQLHGSLRSLRCLNCRQRCSWDEEQGIMSVGKLPICPACPKTTARGRRVELGLLRPDIILYGESDPRADSISEIIQHDLSLDIDLLLIFGTSLAVYGIRELTKNFAKTVHKNKGMVLFINREGPAKSDWSGVIDYWVEWDCDAWVRDLKKRDRRFCLLSTPGGLSSPAATADDDFGRVRELPLPCTASGAGVKKRHAPVSDNPAKRVKKHQSLAIRAASGRTIVSGVLAGT
ncbi:DHS-like NAD/FAD-binding domain-containing protein [Xylariaceae sp. AK1471]|nr:DHS-like NAD/FAD-binding domain-containing protein [Xylariaceae sp. AK1471]